MQQAHFASTVASTRTMESGSALFVHHSGATRRVLREDDLITCSTPSAGSELARKLEAEINVEFLVSRMKNVILSPPPQQPMFLSAR